MLQLGLWVGLGPVLGLGVRLAILWRSGRILALCFHVASRSIVFFIAWSVFAVWLYAFCQNACPQFFFCALVLMCVSTASFALCSSMVLERREQYDLNHAECLSLVEGSGFFSSMTSVGSMADAISLDHSALCCFLNLPQCFPLLAW